MGFRMFGWGCLLLLMAGCSSHFVRQQDGMVHLFIIKPGATSVQFASSLDGYIHHPTIPNKLSRWEAMVKSESEFKYFFIVDGEVYLPSCRFKESDDFGSQTCIYVPDDM